MADNVVQFRPRHWITPEMLADQRREWVRLFEAARANGLDPMTLLMLRPSREIVARAAEIPATRARGGGAG